MVRHIGKYVCKDCGHHFIGMAGERNATADSCSVTCPKCGSTSTVQIPLGALEDPCILPHPILDLIRRLRRKR